jgi:hypothetical protein
MVAMGLHSKPHQRAVTPRRKIKLFRSHTASFSEQQNVKPEKRVTRQRKQGNQISVNPKSCFALDTQ